MSIEVFWDAAFRSWCVFSTDGEDVARIPAANGTLERVTKIYLSWKIPNLHLEVSKLIKEYQVWLADEKKKAEDEKEFENIRKILGD